jgi:hypothetical protein
MGGLNKPAPRDRKGGQGSSSLPHGNKKKRPAGRYVPVACTVQTCLKGLSGVAGLFCGLVALVPFVVGMIGRKFAL